MSKNLRFRQALLRSGLFHFRQFAAFPTSPPVKQTSQSRFATAHLIVQTKKLRKSVALLPCFLVRSVARGSDTSNFFLILKFQVPASAKSKISRSSASSFPHHTYDALPHPLYRHLVLKKNSICELLVRSAFRRSMMKFLIMQQQNGRFAYDSAAQQPKNRGS